MDEQSYANATAGKVPKYLYKYRSLSGESKKFARELILSRNIYLPGPSDLNDPFECKPVFSSSANSIEKKRYIAGVVARTSPGSTRAERRRTEKRMRSNNTFEETFSHSTQITLQNVGIFSLSARHLDLLMWPHYADNHRGICVRFEMQALLDSGKVPFPVIYSENRPTCDIILETHVEWINKAVLTKGDPWSYEEEWRIVVNRGARTKLHLNAPAVNGVILGANISDEDRAEVLEWIGLADRPIGIAQAHFHPSSYELQLRPLFPDSPSPWTLPKQKKAEPPGPALSV